jgi:hypothetical protein
VRPGDGVFPWVQARYVARTGTGHTPSRTRPELWVQDECHIPWFTLADVWQLRDGTRLVVTETEEHVSPAGLANSSAVKHPAGTVLLSRTASVGFSAVMGVDMAVSQDFMTWTPGERVSGRFLLEMQHEIADFLEHENTRITALDHALETLDQGVDVLFRAQVEELAAQAQPVSIKHLGYSVEQGWSPDADDREPVGSEAGVLRLSAVSSGRFDASLAKALAAVSDDALRTYAVHQGDVLLVRASGSLSLLGTACLVLEEPAAPRLFPDLVYRLTAGSPALEPAMLVLMLATSAGRRAIEEAKRGAANNKLRIDDVRNLRVPAPDGEVLSCIRRLESERVSRRARLHGQVAEARARLAEYRESLIAEAVTGVLDVSAVSDDEPARRVAVTGSQGALA